MTAFPGEESLMATRAVHFFWVLDTSSSMRNNGKIGQLNFAIKESLPEMRNAAADNPTAQLLVRVLTFASGARWHIKEPTPVDDFKWSPLNADGVTDLGDALSLLARELMALPTNVRLLPPVIALITDGQPTDDYASALAALNKLEWAQKAVRVGIAVGEDADLDVLQEFLGANPNNKLVPVKRAKELAAAIRWVSTAVVLAASSQVYDGAGVEGTADTDVDFEPPAESEKSDDVFF